MSCSLSTHVLDTGAGRPAAGVSRRAAGRWTARRERHRDGRGRSRARARGRARPARTGSSSTRRHRSSAASSFRSSSRTATTTYPSSSRRSGARATAAAERRRAGGAVRGSHALRRAACRRARPARARRTLVHELTADEKREVLDAHPAIGQRAGLSARSAAEQGADAEPEVLAELAHLNADYEERHGFRFVVFVNRRPKARDPRRATRADRQPDGRRARDGARGARGDRRGSLAAPVSAVAAAGARSATRLARPRPALAARGRGDRVDRRVVLLRAARPVAPAAERPGRRRRRASAASCGRSTAAASTRCRSTSSLRAAARSRRLVQVGGVHDVALGLRR